MVKREENRTILPQSLLQSSRLSIKEPKQDVVPQAMGSPQLSPSNFLMPFPNKVVTWGKKRIVGQ